MRLTHEQAVRICEVYAGAEWQWPAGALARAESHDWECDPTLPLEDQEAEAIAEIDYVVIGPVQLQRPLRRP